MNDNLIRNEGQTLSITPDETLKATALLYLEDALSKESFEECAELVQSAKKFGAITSEISKVIAGYVQGKTQAEQNEANQAEGRLRP